MNLRSQVLKLAKEEVVNHLMADLNYAVEFHQYMSKRIEAIAYLNSPHGFKRFLYDYRVGRTLQAGDEAKMGILLMIRDFNFNYPHFNSITSLANAIRERSLSSRSGTGRHGLPQSFASKLLSVYKPDEVIPYDSYALKSLELQTSRKLKDLSSYYEAVEIFRVEYFPENSKEVKLIKKKVEKSIRKKMDELNLDEDKLLSWKLTDKYLWCDHYVRRIK